MTTDWRVLPDGRVELPKWEHEYEWGPWSEWAPRADYPVNYQRTRVCLNGCGIDEIQTEYRPKED